MQPEVIDIGNPANPVRVGGCDTSGGAEGVAVSGNYAYMADGQWGLQVLRIEGAPLLILNPAITATGQFEFTVAGKLSGTLRTQWSEDLVEWHLLALPAVEQLPAVLRDERPVSARQRFYRVLLLP